MVHANGLKKKFDLFLARKIKVERYCSYGCFTADFWKKVLHEFPEKPKFCRPKVRPDDGMNMLLTTKLSNVDSFERFVAIQH
jgi:hypothetical protein